jgi:hypothetical protein
VQYWGWSLGFAKSSSAGCTRKFGEQVLVRLSFVAHI